MKEIIVIFMIGFIIYGIGYWRGCSDSAKALMDGYNSEDE